MQVQLMHDQSRTRFFHEINAIKQGKVNIPKKVIT